MKNHLKTLGTLYFLFGMLGVAVAIIFLQAVTGHEALPRRVLPFSTSGFGSVLATFFALTSIPGVIAGLGLLLQQSWARPFVLILGYVNLFNIPLGTILGIYTIWIITKERDTEISDSEAVVEKELPRVFPPYHWSGSVGDHRKSA